MKNYYILLAAVMLFFSSCEQLKDLANIDFDAAFNADIPVTSSAATKSASLENAEYPFGGSYLIELDSNEEVAKYLDLLKGINLTGYTMNPVGLSADAVLNSLIIKVNAVEMLNVTNVVSASEFTEADISQDAIDELNKALLKDKKVTISVTGSSNMPLLSFIISQLIETTITANPL